MNTENAALRGLTFELTGPWRRGALARTERMYCVPQAGPRCPAVAGPVERGVRRRSCRGTASDWRPASGRCATGVLSLYECLAEAHWIGNAC